MATALRPSVRTAALLAAWITSTGVFAAAAPDAFPSKPVRWIVPFVAGIGTDTISRTVAAKLSERWGQQVVVDNRPGAAGAVGVEALLNAPADGYTICLISASHAVAAGTHPKLSYDLLRDVRAVAQLTSLNYVIYVHPSVPVRTIPELIAHAKSYPNKLNFGSSGTGGLQHLAGEFFKHITGIHMTHVPYKGGAQVNAEVMAGNIQLGFGTLQSRRFYTSGKLRPLGITGRTRSPIAPELPTVIEQGVPGYEVDQWYGVVTPAKVPVAIVNRLSQAIAEAVKQPDIAQRWLADATTPVGSTPEQFSAHLRAEIDKWRKLARDVGLNLQ